MLSIKPGIIALFYQTGNLTLGIITQCEGSLVSLTDTKGIIYNIPLSRICLQSTELYGIQQPLQSVNHFLGLIQAETGVLDAALHIMANGASFSFEEVASALGELSDARLFALFMGLREATELLAHKKGKYRILDESERQSFISARQQKQQRDEYLTVVRDVISDCMALNEPGDYPASLQDKIIQELQSLQREQIPQDLEALIKRAMPGSKPEENISRLRKYLGDITPQTDPILAASGLPLEIKFPLAGLNLSERECPEAQGFEVFCVDDSETMDYDDAISIQSLELGYRIGIHISHLSAVIDHQSQLFDAALKRVSSLYLPSQTVNMLPAHLAQRELSLRANTAHEVLSLYADLDRDLNLLSTTFVRETLSIGKNQSYKDFDASINSFPSKILHAFGIKLKKERSDGLGQPKDGFEYKIMVEGGKIRLKKIDLSSPARGILEELMVFYNSQMAALALQSQIPFIYRNINSFDEEENGEEEQGTARTGTQAYYSLIPQFHPGIGVKAYLHATSPIRRVVDLINQFQFSALLEQKPAPFDADLLKNAIPQIEKRILLQRDVSRRSERYWLLNWLKQNWLNTPIDAVFIKKSAKGAIFEILPWQKRIVIVCVDCPHQDREIKLVIYEVDVMAGLCRADVFL